MDNGVALVQAYLRVNGYFTVAEYPVVEAMRDGGYRMATDLDILAFRFPGSGRLIPGYRKYRPKTSRPETGNSDMLLAEAPDEALGIGRDEADMLIGEVKEGRAELNQAARDASVLRCALTRFGCCPPDHVPHLVEALLRNGKVTTPGGHRIRMVAFGSIAPGGAHPYAVILLGHVVSFLREYLRANWDVLHTAEFKDPAFGFLMTLEKAGRGLPAAARPSMAPGVSVQLENGAEDAS
jgi:hypothetical protein